MIKLGFVSAVVADLSFEATVDLAAEKGFDAVCFDPDTARVAALADMYETMMAPHNYYSHLSTFMNAHLCAVIPNLKILETDFDSVPWRDDIITELPDIKNGYLGLPKKPGLGAELNEKEIAKHPWPK